MKTLDKIEKAFLIILILSLAVNVAFLTLIDFNHSELDDAKRFELEYYKLKTSAAVQVKNIDSLKSKITVLKDSLQLKIIHTKKTNTRYEKLIQKAIAIRDIDSLSAAFITNANR
ncbi:MAG: hypothetical protein HRT69_10885 [Flavobacteriaceae bacterium]|nr:hypothetical protein [Flavobacteriaceae bacterium]